MAWVQFDRLMAFLDRVANVDSNAADDFNTAKDAIDELAGNSGSSPDKTVQENADDIVTIQAQLGTSKSVTANYTILDDDGHDKFYINPTAGNITLTLPTLSANQDRKLLFLSTDLGGKITIDGEGAEKIGGYSELILQSKNDRLEIVGEAGEWQIISYSAKYETGYQNRSDWTSVKLGTSAFDFDNRSGAFTIGELITEETSDNTGIIQSMTDAADGIIYVKNVTGTGIWTNNKTITGATSGETCLVNEGGGTNKNQDTDILHQLVLPSAMLDFKIYVSTDGTDNNSFFVDASDASEASTLGQTLHQTDTSNSSIFVEQDGIIYVDTSKQRQLLDSDDFYMNLIAEVRI